MSIAKNRTHTRILFAGLIAVSALLAACGTNRAGFTPGQDSRFAKPANLGPKIEITAEMIGGHTYTITDEIGTNYVRIAKNGTATAGEGPDRVDEPGATWWIKDGNLCLRGKKWWTKKGNCMQFYGGTELKDVTHIAPTYVKDGGQNRYYPARIIN